MSSYRTIQVREILSGEAWLRAFIDISMFIKGLISSVKLWCMFLVTELQAWLISFSSSPLLFLSPSFSCVIPTCSPEVLGTFRSPPLTQWMPSTFLTFSSPYHHIHLSTSFCLLCPVCAMIFLSYIWPLSLPSLSPSSSWCEHFFLLLLSCSSACPHLWHI